MPAAIRARAVEGELVLEAPPELSGLVEDLARRAARIVPRLEASLGTRPAGPFRIFLVPAAAYDDPEIARLDRRAPPWAAGFLVPRERVGAIRIARARGYPHEDVASVLAHEVVHMLLHDAAGGRLPRWFEEGVATWESRRWGWRDAYVYSTVVLTGGLPGLDEMNRGFHLSASEARAAYAASFDLVSYTAKQHGERVIRDIVAEAAVRPFPAAWQAATGVALSRSEASWRRRSLLRFRWVPAVTGTTTVWIGITLLVFVARARRRSRSRVILERWESEETPPPPPAAGP